MSDVKHTPGPWLVHKKDDDFEIGTGAWADWGDSDMAFSEFQVATAWGGHESNYANARLIAAAPELLEACHDALGVIEASGRTDIYDKMFAAIAKVKGDK